MIKMERMQLLRYRVVNRGWVTGLKEVYTWPEVRKLLGNKAWVYGPSAFDPKSDRRVAETIIVVKDGVDTDEQYLVKCALMA